MQPLLFRLESCMPAFPRSGPEERPFVTLVDPLSSLFLGNLPSFSSAILELLHTLFKHVHLCKVNPFACSRPVGLCSIRSLVCRCFPPIRSD